MSWKACAFVKDLRDGLSVSEKFVLLILAEYHRTDEKLTWPSIATLSKDCLMTERGIRKIIARLISGGFLEHSHTGGGRGNIAGYRIVGVDGKGEPETLNSGSVNTETVFVGAVNPERKRRNPEPRGNAIRKERVEPIKQPINQNHIPDWVPLEAWNGFVEMRRKMHKIPFTDRAINLALADLQKLVSQGEDAEQVLNKATLNSWRGLYPVKNGNGNGAHDNNKTAAQLRNERFDAMAERAIREAPPAKNQPSPLFKGIV